MIDNSLYELQQLADIVREAIYKVAGLKLNAKKRKVIPKMAIGTPKEESSNILIFP